MKLLLKIGLSVGFLGLAGCQSASIVAKNTQSDLPEVKPAVIVANASLGNEISSAFAREPKLRGSSIGVSISNLNGSVTLIGTIERVAQEKLALQIAERLVKKKSKDVKVISQLKIQALVPVGKPDKTKSKKP